MVICRKCALHWFGSRIVCWACNRTVRIDYCLAGLDPNGDVKGGALSLMEYDPVTGDMIGPHDRECRLRNPDGNCTNFISNDEWMKRLREEAKQFYEKSLKEGLCGSAAKTT